MREKGTFRTPFNYEREKEGNIDATKFVPTYCDLFTFTESNYMYNGATVEVWDNNINLRGLYMLLNSNDLSNPNSWKKITTEKPTVTLNKKDNITLLKTNWVLDGNLYKIDLFDDTIKMGYVVDFVPYNDFIEIIINSEILPHNTVFNGKTVFYSKNEPTGNITGEIIIFGNVE